MHFFTLPALAATILRRAHTQIDYIARAVCIGVFVLASTVFQQPAQARTLRTASAGELRTADPHAFNDSTYNAILRSMYEPLVDYNPKSYKIHGVLAEKWRFINPTHLEFTLKKNVFFHNGDRLTASDVAFSIMRAAHPSSTFRIYTSGIKEVRVRDALTLDIISSSPNPVLLNQLTELLVVNQAWMKANNALSAQKIDTHPAQALTQVNGTGPFTLKNWGKGTQIVFAKNPNWWGRLPDRSPVQIEYHAIPNHAERVKQLLDGKLELLFDPPVDGLGQISIAPGLTTLQGLDNRVLFIGMDQARPELLYSNIKGRNPLSNPIVRQALYHAIDIKKIQQDTMAGQAEPRGTIVAPHVTGWSKNLDKRLDYNPRLAKVLLTKAGYPNGFQSQLLCTNNRYLNDEAVCHALAKMWAAVNVTVTVDAKPISKAVPEMHMNQFSLYFFGWASPTFDAHYSLNSLIRSPTSTVQRGINGTGYHNPKIDRLIDQIATESDAAKRNALISSVLETVRSDVAIIPLYNQVSHWAHSRKVSLTRRSDMRPDWTSIQIRGE